MHGINARKIAIATFGILQVQHSTIKPMPTELNLSNIFDKSVSLVNIYKKVQRKIHPEKDEFIKSLI